MSPRAAWRLVALGVSPVYDYMAGKMDWFAYGLPSEGERASKPRAGDVCRKDVPTCRLDERLGEVRARVQAAGWETCAVVNERQTLLGAMRGKDWERPGDMLVEDVMTSGPTTIRPSEELEAIAERQRKQDVSANFVTRNDGTLVGLLLREDAERNAETGSSGETE